MNGEQTRDLRGPAGWAIRLLVVQALLAGLAVLLARMHGPGFNDENGSAPYLLVAFLQLCVGLACAVFVLRWIYLATANVHRFGAQNLNAGPALAIGWYFIPLANLAMPLQSMREIWKASINPRDWEVIRLPALPGFWWGFWLLYNISGVAAFRFDDPETYPEAGRAAEWLVSISDAAALIASLLLVVIIRKITALQARISC